MKKTEWGCKAQEVEHAEEGTSSGGGEGEFDGIDNRIYFYSDVSRDKVLQLNKKIRSLNGELAVQRQKLSLPQTPDIFLHINSHGGSIFSGLSAMDEVLNSKAPVTTIIDGCCASAATFFSVAGHHRQMNRHSYILIHQLSSVMWGKYSEFQDEMTNLNRFMQMIRDIYDEHAKVPKKKLAEILKHDLWWDADTCLRYGLVDEII